MVIPARVIGALVARARRQAVILATALVLAGQAGAQCALCKQALESGGKAGLIQGLQWSSVLLLSAPALLIGGIGTRIYFTWRSSQR